MARNEQIHSHDKNSPTVETSKPAIESVDAGIQQQTGTPAIIQKTRLNPHALAPREVLQLQRTVGNHAVGHHLNRAGNGPPIQRKENNTGLPDTLKTGVENLSGIALDDVKVHYNSPKPAEIQALAYTQGSEIHVGPGEEKHLPHEAWHVVQQKQGRVAPTFQLKDELAINDAQPLEQEATRMGELALTTRGSHPAPLSVQSTSSRVIQGMLDIDPGLLYALGQMAITLGIVGGSKILNYLHSTPSGSQLKKPSESDAKQKEEKKLSPIASEISSKEKILSLIPLEKLSTCAVRFLGALDV